MHLLIYHLNTQDNLYCIIFNSALIFSNLQFVFTFRGVLKIHKNTNHLPRPLFLLSHCQDPISTPQHYLNTPILQYVWVIDQVWDQDGCIMAKFLFCLFMDWDEVQVHKLAKKERGQYPAILTEQSWSIKDLLCGFRCSPERSILPARVANHRAQFGSSCPLAGLAI